MTEDALAALLSLGCAICGELEDLCVDHNHSCCPGKTSCGRCVRGVLCRRCNLAIGYFGDDVTRLRDAIAYLTQ